MFLSKLADKYKGLKEGYKFAKGLDKTVKGVGESVINPGGTLMNETMDVMWMPGSFISGLFEGARKGTFFKELGEARKLGGIREMQKFARERAQTWNPWSIGPLSTLTKAAGFATSMGVKTVVSPIKLVTPVLNIAGGAAFRGGVAATEHVIKQIPGAIDLVGGSILQTARVANRVSNSRSGKAVLGYGALAGFGTYGVLSTAREQNLPQKDPYMINPYVTPGLEDDSRFAPKLIDKKEKKDNSLSKTAMMQVDDVAIAATRSSRIDSLGATGDLVFALHNRR